MKITAVIAAACAGVLVALAVPKSFNGASDVLRAVMPHERQATHKALAPAVKRAEAAAPSLKLDLGQSLSTQPGFQSPDNARSVQALQAYARTPPVTAPPAK